MRRLLPSLAAVLALCVASTAQAGSLDLRGGAFFPRADTGALNDLFRDDATLYTVQKSDWVDFTGGIQYNMKVVKNLEAGIGFDFYGQTVHTEYRDYERESGAPIQQSLMIDILPMSLELRLIPTSRRAKVAPFVGVGFDLYFWKYEEFGEFVRFSDPSLPVIEDSFISEGVNPGFHVTGGIRFPINDDIGITAQGKYQWGTAEMGDDFRGNKLDLSGASVTLGLTIRF
jgi:hypothetical protein